MGNSWAGEKETELLQAFMPNYELCQVNRNYQTFWPRLFSSFGAAFPLIEKIWPNQGKALETLTGAENEVYNKKLKSRHDSLKEWFRWRANPRSRNTTTAVTKKDLKKIYQPARTRGRKNYEVFAKLYADVVDPVYEESCRVQGAKGKHCLPIWHKVASRMWKQASQEQIDAVSATIESELARAEDTDAEDESPATYQYYLRLLPGVLTATIDPAVRKAGVVAVCTVIGPVPEAGGQIVATTLQFGDSGTTPLFSSAWSGHEEIYIEHLASFMRKYEFPDDLCARRSLTGGAEAIGESGSSHEKSQGCTQAEHASIDVRAPAEAQSVVPDPSAKPVPAPQWVPPVILPRAQTAAPPSAPLGQAPDAVPTPTPAPPAPHGDVHIVQPRSTQPSPPVVTPAAVDLAAPTPEHPYSLSGLNAAFPQFPPQQFLPVQGTAAAHVGAPRLTPDLYGPYSATPDPELYLEPQQPADYNKSLINGWDAGAEGPMKTWDDCLAQPPLPNVDLSIFQTSSSNDWCNINTFNAIAQENALAYTHTQATFPSSNSPSGFLIPASNEYPSFPSSNFHVPNFSNTLPSGQTGSAFPPASNKSSIFPSSSLHTPNAPNTLPSGQSGSGLPSLRPTELLLAFSRPREPASSLVAVELPTSTSSASSVLASTDFSVASLPGTSPSASSSVASAGVIPAATAPTLPPTFPPATNGEPKASDTRLNPTPFMLSMRPGFGGSLLGNASSSPGVRQPEKVQLPPTNKENNPAQTTSPNNRSTCQTSTSKPSETPQAPAPHRPTPRVRTHIAPPCAPTPHVPTPRVPILVQDPHPQTAVVPPEGTARRSAREHIKSMLEKQNLIGTNIISHSAAASATPLTDNASEDETPPPWFTAALEHLEKEDLGVVWAGTVRKWAELERTLGYGKVGKTPFPAKGRPEEWGKWTVKSKNGIRPYHNLPRIQEPAEFGLAILKWWYSVQPPFRASENNFPLPIFSDDSFDGDAWSALRKSGPNGFVVFMTMLAWWGRTAHTANTFGEDSRPAWWLLVADVSACIDAISTSTSDNRKRALAGDASERPHKRQKT